MFPAYCWQRNAVCLCCAMTVREPQSAPLEATVLTMEPSPRLIIFGIVLFCAALFTIVLTGLPQLMDNEWRLSAYVLDALQNGRWFCPTDANGEAASKPPMLTWLAALIAGLSGSVSPFALYWPTACATALTAWVIFRTGRTEMGWRAGFLGAFCYVISHIGLSQMSMPRYDGLLSLPVTICAVAAFSAWQTGRGWTWFWLIAALGTLVKGPIAVILPAFGLFAFVWERFSHPVLPIRGSHVPGLVLYFSITGGWFALAYVQMGQAMIDKMLGHELVGHAIRDGGGLFSGLHQPTLTFLALFAPWSLVGLVAFWRVLRHPTENPQERRFERFVLCWFVSGLIALSIAAHQRGRLIYPLIPAAALLCGQELARWTVRLSPRRLLAFAGIIASVFLAGTFVYTHVLIAKSRRVQETLAMQALAQQLQSVGRGEFPLEYVHSPASLQVWLNTRRARISSAQAATILQSPTPAFVVIRDYDALRRLLPAHAQIFEVYRWPARGVATTRIISNHPRLERPLSGDSHN